MSLTLYPLNLPGQIYGNPLPFDLFDPSGKVLQDVQTAGIYGVALGVPLHGGLFDLLTQAGEQAAQGHNILLHCSAGLGRTALNATLLAGYVLRLSGTEAIEWLGLHQPGARLTPAHMYGGGSS